MSNESVDLSRISDGVDALRTANRADPDELLHGAEEFLRALGWGDHHGTALRSAPDPRDRVDYICESWSDPVFFVRVVRAPHQHDREVGQALAYAYNCGKDWSLALSNSEAGLFNALWQETVSDPDTPFRSLDLEDYERQLSDLWLLSPPAIEEGVFEEQASKAAPRRIRPRIQEKLLGDLQASRHQLLEVGQSTNLPNAELDRWIHLLITRLIFLRSAEDRGTPLPLSLADLLDVNEPGKHLQGMFEECRERFDAELFQPIIPLEVFGDSIRTPVESLIGAPELGVEYDFDLIDIDVLGKTYERYLSSVPKAGSGELQLHFEDFGTYELDEVRRRHGVYYTPPAVVDYIVKNSLQQLAWDKEKPPRVVDLSCGSGTFLVHAIQELRQEDRWDDREIVNNIYGVDVDPRAAMFTRLNCWLSLGDKEPLPTLGSNIVVDEALLHLPLNQDGFPGEFDLVIGNPPYRGIEGFPDDSDGSYKAGLEDRYHSATGRYDMAALFVEQGLRVLRPGGVLCMIVTNRLLTSASAESLRRFIVDVADVVEVVDFTDMQVFSEAKSYTAILTLQRRDEPQLQETRVAKVKSTDRPLVGVMRQLGKGIDPSDDIEVYSTKSPGRSEPWYLLSPRERDILDFAREQSVPLGDVAEFYQGVKTGANDLYLLHKAQSTGGKSGRLQYVNRRGETWEIERELARPAIKRVTGRYLFPQSSLYVIYPYQNGEVIPPTVLEKEYNATYTYFKEHERELRDRATVKRRGGIWYELSWPRKEAWLSKPKVVVPSIAGERQFGVDYGGSYAPVGLTAVVPEEIGLWPMAVILNSSIGFYFLKALGKRFQGDWVDIKQRDLRQLWVPRRLLGDRGAEEFIELCRQVKQIVTESDRSIIERLSKLSKLDDQITDSLLDLYGVPTEQWK